METKRCQRCHKLLRPETQLCSGCGGRDFTPALATKSRLTVKLPHRQDDVSFPSNPPASPHRAGHYSGLHPEDQPYQSSFLPVQRPASFAVVDQPGEHAREDAYATMEEQEYESQVAKRRVATFAPLPQLRQQRGTQTYPPPLLNQVYTPTPDELSQDVPEEDILIAQTPPTLPAQEPMPLTLRPAPRRRAARGGIVPILLILSCLLFLIATSILTFLLLSNKSAPTLSPTLIAQPDSLRPGDQLVISGSGFPANDQILFTLDNGLKILGQNAEQLEAITYPTGTFAVQIIIPSGWSVGSHTIFAADRQNLVAEATIAIESTPSTPPRLAQLSSNHIDAGAGNIGTITHESLELSNSGGGQVFWKASSDASWLSADPSSGKFFGSATVDISVNRGTLTPQSYTGHLTFTQFSSQQSSTPLATLHLTVTMSVNPAPTTTTQLAAPNLALTNAALTFSGTPAKNPPGQAITLQNTGGQALNWTTATTTTGGGNWLVVSPFSGALVAGEQMTVTVSAITAGLGAGSYSGTLTFSYGGSSASVVVTLTVSLPPNPALAVQPASGLVFNSYQGQSALPQSFTISNPGNAALNWGITEDANGLKYAQVSATSGTLPAGHSVGVTVTPSTSQLSASTINALITVSDTDKGSTVKVQNIPLTFTIVNQAAINLNPNQLSFSLTSTIQSSSQTILLTDTGSVTLNWGLSIINASPVPWLSVDSTSGSVVPNALLIINVTANSANLDPGTYTATIQIYDTDTNTPVKPQTVTVTLTVS